ncbi:radical SAM protein [bacterium]|nr:radical SAM protein [bacterium]
MLKNLNRAYHYGRCLLDRGRPHYMILYVTARCNLRCPHCFYLEEIESAKKDKELKIEEFEKISRSLPSLLQLTCTGGETFVRQDIDEIAEIFYRNSNTRFFTFTTNATYPERTAEKVEKICRACPYAVIRVPMSLDGIGEIHDKVRGLEGTFERVMETYRLLDSLSRRLDNLRLDVTSVLSQLNEDHLPAITEFVKDRMEIENHTILYARGAIREPEKIVPKKQKYKDLVRGLLGRSEKKYRFPLISRVFVRLREAVEATIIETQKMDRMPVTCQAGESFIELNEYGNLFPCEILQTLMNEGKARPTEFTDTWMGDVREFDYDVPKALNSQKSLAIRKFIQNKGCSCTFECAIGSTLAFHPSNWGRLITQKAPALT